MSQQSRTVAALSALVVLLVLTLLVVTLSGRGGDDVDDAGDGDGGRAAPPAPTAEAPAAAVTGPPLTWAPPALEDPETVQITEDDYAVDLDDDRDYLLVLPDEPLVLDDDVEIKGGHDVVLIGGRIENPGGDRALHLLNQTGTLHVEGVSIGGEGLKEGINLDQRAGGTVQLQNIRIDQVTGSRDGHHADLLQTWAGPTRLRVDGFVGRTTYQGMFLLPQQRGEVRPESFDLRRVAITGTEEAAYLLWTAEDVDFPITTTDVVLGHEGDRDGLVRPEDVWSGVRRGDPAALQLPGGEPGTGYTSPGYAG